MASVNDLLDRLQARGYGADLETTQLQLLDAAWSRFLGNRRWSFFDATTEQHLVAGDSNFSLDDLTDDVRFLDAVRLQGDLDPVYVPYQQFTRQFGHLSGTGTPQYWTRINQTIELYPAADRALTLLVDYNKRPPLLSALDPDEDQVPVPDPYDDIPVWGAIADICFRERDWDARADARQSYMELRAECLAEYGVSQRQTSGQVASSGFFDPFDVEAVGEVI